jgi:hypothetical protein
LKTPPCPYCQTLLGLHLSDFNPANLCPRHKGTTKAELEELSDMAALYDETRQRYRNVSRKRNRGTRGKT